MLTVYLIALGIGGTLLAVSLFLDSSDADTDVDVDADVDADVDHGDVGVDALIGWLPLTSVRFWTFFLAFGGGTGALFTIFELTGSAVVNGAVAGGVGWVTGFAAVRIIRSLRGRQTSSGLTMQDYVGCAATVVLPVRKGKTGKVNIDIKGRRVTALAETEDDATFDTRERVVVYDVTDDGRVMVTRSSELPA